MFSTKSILAAASLAVLTAAGIGAASAQPYWDRHDNRAWHRYERIEHRAQVSRWRIAEALRFRGLHMVSEPRFFDGHMVVRAENRFGRPLIVHVNPYTGDVMRVIRL